MRINGCGWAKRTKEKGPAFPVHCTSCDSETTYNLVLARYWLYFIFIPFLPISSQSQYLYCAECGQTFEIEKSAEAERAKKATEITKPFLNNTYPSEEYWPEINDYLEKSTLFQPPERNSADIEEELPEDANRGFQ